MPPVIEKSEVKSEEGPAGLRVKAEEGAAQPLVEPQANTGPHPPPTLPETCPQQQQGGAGGHVKAEGGCEPYQEAAEVKTEEGSAGLSVKAEEDDGQQGQEVKVEAGTTGLQQQQQPQSLLNPKTGLQAALQVCGPLWKLVFPDGWVGDLLWKLGLVAALQREQHAQILIDL